MEANLVLFRGDGQLKAIPLKKGVNILGRRTDCDVRIPEGIVSRKHCRIVKSEDSLTVQDLGSANGTFVNSERIMEATIQAGDRLTVGSIIFTVQIDGKPEKIQPPPPPDSLQSDLDPSDLSGSAAPVKPAPKKSQTPPGPLTEDDILADLGDIGLGESKS